MVNKRYTVISIQTAHGPEYVIEDTLMGAYVGFFDTQKWAESIADVMEEQWKEKKENGRFKKQDACKGRKFNTTVEQDYGNG